MTKHDDRLGATIAGKYELRRVLGVGGMGSVYEARHRYTDKMVAVKLMHRSLSESRQHALRFMREAKAASAIGHPAIVDVLDAGEEPDGTLYLVLELLHGEDLGARIDRGGIEATELAEIATQLCDGLAFAHDSGIVHRDIKPENVFLTLHDDGKVNVKILDFGVAKQAGPDAAVTMEGTVLGTPYYMSPEQARGEPVDARADLWSIGAVMFHALVGEPPFVDANYNKLILKILTERPRSLAIARPDTPDWMVRVVDRALTPLASERWQDARAMASALREGRGLPTSGTGAAAPRAPFPRVTPIAMTPSPDEHALTLDAPRGPDPTKTTPSAWESHALPAPRKRPMGLILGVGVAAMLALGVGGYLVASSGGDPAVDPTEAQPQPIARPEVPPAQPPVPPPVIEPQRVEAPEPIVAATPDAGPARVVRAARPQRTRPAKTTEAPPPIQARTKRGIDPIRSYD